MKKTTLITSLGTGMYKEGYRKTDYQFSDQRIFTEKSFLFAVLKHSPEITKVVLVGTRTSSWDILVETDEKAWEHIYAESSSPDGLNPESEPTICEHLEETYPGIKFVLKVHTPTLDDNTVEEVLGCYNTITDEIAFNSNVIFDITHGFRSMPLLIYQALQLDTEKIATCNVSLIYGEYIPAKKISFVRELSAYWEVSEITREKAAFFSRFDGKRLAERLKLHWAGGSKVVQSWTDCVACNFAIQLPECLRQTKNAIDKFQPLDDTPRWILDIRDFLSELYNNLSQPEDYRTVLNFARILNERKLITQSVIALQIAIELAITDYFGKEDDRGDYDWWQDEGRDCYCDIKQDLPEKEQKHLSKIEGTRNQLAHGGGKSKHGGRGFPQAVNMPAVLKNGFSAVETLFEELEKTTN